MTQFFRSSDFYLSKKGKKNIKFDLQDIYFQTEIMFSNSDRLFEL